MKITFIGDQKQDQRPKVNRHGVKVAGMDYLFWRNQQYSDTPEWDNEQ